MGLVTPITSIPGPERKRLLFVVLGFMSVASSALIARTAGDALFLSGFSTDLLSYMYIGTAIVVGGASYMYAHWASRLSISRITYLTCCGLICLTIAVRIGLTTSWSGFLVGAYLLSDLLVNVPMMLFWSFAALIFDPRNAKRYFGFVGAGGTFACIFAGFLIRPFVNTLGLSNLLLLVVLFTAGFMFSVWRLSRLEGSKLQTGPGSSGSSKGASSLGYYKKLLSGTQVTTLVILVIVATFSLSLTDYVFKASAQKNFQADELAGFFGNFYAYTNIVALLIQVFLVARILQKGGILLGLIILPLGLVITTAGAVFTSQFVWIVAAKFTVQIFLFTIDIAALQMLYLGIQKQSRSQSRAFIDGIGKPIAIAVTGLGLIGISPLLPLHQIMIGTLVASLIWLFLARTNYRAYLDALVDSLGSQRLDLSEETADFHDKSFENHLKQSLSTAADAEIPYLIDLLPTIGNIDWTPEFRILMARSNPTVKIAALQHLQENGDESDLPSVISLVSHEDPNVRCAAISAAASLGSIETVERIEGGLEDTDSTVRAATVASLINTGDLDYLLNAGVVLKAMLQSEEVDDRIGAASALSDVKSADLIRPLVGLLQDPDARVRNAALAACKNHLSPRLIPTIIPLLSDPAVATFTEEILSSFGPGALDHLIPYLELADMEGAFSGAQRIPRILVNIGERSSLPILLKASEATDSDIRSESIQGYCHLVETAPSLKPYIEDLQALAKRELLRAEQLAKYQHQIDQLPGTEILNDALKAEYNNALKNAFTVMDTSTPNVDLHAVLIGLTSNTGDNRAYALEILDNVVDRSLRPTLLGLLESTDHLQESSDSSDVYETLEQLAAEEGEWIVSGALYAAISDTRESTAQMLVHRLSHPSPVVRETALFGLGELGDSRIIQESCLRLREDPHPNVRLLADSLATTPDDPS